MGPPTYRWNTIAAHHRQEDHRAEISLNLWRSAWAPASPKVIPPTQFFFPYDQTGKRGSEKVVGGAWEESEKGNKWKVGSHHHLVLLRPPPPPKGKKKTESPKSNYLTPTNLEAPSIPLLLLSPFLRNHLSLSHSLFLSPPRLDGTFSALGLLVIRFLCP